MARHFFKIFSVFLGMIILGLVGVLVINYLDNRAEDDSTADANTEVAK
jgi:hypothetical protein